MFWRLFVLIILLNGCGGNADQQIEQADQKLLKAKILFDQQQYPEAISLLKEAIVINDELKRDTSLGENYLLMAQAQRFTGRYDTALSDFKSALEYFHLSGDKKSERKGKILLADYYLSLRYYSSAAALSFDAVTESRFFADSYGLYRALAINASSNVQRGKADMAIPALDELLKIDRTNFNGRDQSKWLGMKMDVSVAAGSTDAARAIFNQWKKSAIAAGDTMSLIRAYYRWGIQQQTMAHNDSTLTAFSRALGLLNEQPSRELQSDVLLSLGNLAFRSRQFDIAVSYYSDALAFAHETNNIVVEQFLNLMIIACDWNQKTAGRNTADVIKRTDEVKEVCAKGGFSIGEAFADLLLARFAEQQQNLPGAVKSYEHARQIIRQQESLPPGSRIAEILNAYFEGEQSGWYDGLLQLYCSLEKSEDVFEAMEENNLHELQGFFTRLSLAPQDQHLGSLIEGIQFKRRCLALLENDIIQQLQQGRKRNFEYLQSLVELHRPRVEELQSLAGEIETANRNFSTLMYSQSVHMKDIQNVLPASSAIVEYVSTAKWLYALVLMRDTVYIQRTSVAKQTLLSQISEYNNVIGDARIHGNVPMFNEAGTLVRINELSPVLYNHLVVPILPVLDRIMHLYIVPPAEFGWLPFHTLRPSSEDQPLIARYAISYLPSAAALLFTHDQEKYVKNVVGFGHPGRSGWDVEYEIKDIRSFYEKAKMLFDTSATLEHLHGVPYDVLHIGTEFILDTNVPDNSVMTLSDGVTPDGLKEVPLGELISLPPAQTLVFSNITAQPGGLSRYAAMLFLANGSQTVVTTMWHGDRKAKRYFGEIFYTSLTAGTPAGQAYQQAMIALLRQNEFAHLYKWGLYYRFGR